MITCLFIQFTLYLRFTKVMRKSLRRGRKILNPRPTLGSLSALITHTHRRIFKHFFILFKCVSNTHVHKTPVFSEFLANFGGACYTQVHTLYTSIQR